MKNILIILAVLLASGGIWGQRNILEQGIPNINVVKTSEMMTLDGELTEEVWSKCNPATNFSQYFPTDSILAKGQTEVFFASDEENLYVAAICYSSGDNFLTQNLKRDYGFRSTDNLSIMFDTYGDNTNSFMFGVNAFGAIREAQISNGGRQRNDFDDSWDNKWYGNAKIDGNKWIAEIKIPFKSIRFTENSEEWRIQIYRNDSQCNEMSTWINLPRNFILMNMSFMGNLNWEEPAKKQGNNLAIIPYITGSSISDFEDSVDDPSYNWNVGGDVKFGITSSLNLDLTVNPDFSQVEVDRQVTNLDRFEIFFPERRQFFLENADLFSQFGKQTLNPFFSRRIGVAYDTTSQVNIQNAVHYGARLSGKINDNLRIGVMNMQTAADIGNDVPIFNYSIVSLQQKVFTKSNIAFIAINKQAIQTQDYSTSLDPYNRLAGLEYRYFSDNDKWYGKMSLMRSFSASEKENNYSHLVRLGYTVRAFQLEWEHSMIGNGFDAEVGFVPRKDILQISPQATLSFYPENTPVSRHEFQFSLRQNFKLAKEEDTIVEDFRLIDAQYDIRHNIAFINNVRLNSRLRYEDIFLLSDFDPTRIQEDEVFLSAGTRYNFLAYTLSFNSDNRKIINYEINTTVGQFYNGDRYGVGGRLNYRFQPFGVVSLNFNYNRIILEDPFLPSNLWLIGPMFDLSFSKKLFLTTFIQYNNQLDNLNINARLQWRYKPASDIFFVYTDNYITNPFDEFGSRNRAFVFKANYWLSL